MTAEHARFMSYVPDLKIAVFLGTFLLVGYFKNLNKKSEAKLAEKNRLLKAQEAQKTQSFVNIAHEIRTPLTILNGLIHDLKKTEYEKIAIDKQVKNLQFIVSNIIDLTRMDAGALKLSLVEVNVNQLVSEVFQSFQSNFERKQIRFSLTYQDSHSHLYSLAHKETLERALNNLCSNALKFTPSGKAVAITVTSSEESVKLLISDEGIGIPEKDIPHIFDKFYQVENSYALSGGSGVGLAFCERNSPNAQWQHCL